MDSLIFDLEGYFQENPPDVCPGGDTAIIDLELTSCQSGLFWMTFYYTRKAEKRSPVILFVRGDTKDDLLQIEVKVPITWVCERRSSIERLLPV